MECCKGSRMTFYLARLFPFWILSKPRSVQKIEPSTQFSYLQLFCCQSQNNVLPETKYDTKRHKSKFRLGSYVICDNMDFLGNFVNVLKWQGKQTLVIVSSISIRSIIIFSDFIDFPQCPSVINTKLAGLSGHASSMCSVFILSHTVGLSAGLVYSVLSSV